MSITKKSKTIDNIVETCVIKTLPTISGETEYKYLNETIQELYENATTLETTLLVRKHGHVGPATIIMRTPWKYPKYPGASPTIPMKSTVYHRQQSNNTHSEER